MTTSDLTPWRPIVEQYETPRLASSVWQILNSIVPYLVLWVLMVWTVSFSYLLTLVLGVFTAGFWIRIFIISHDCGHGSFFKSRRANEFWGTLTGVMTLTPYLSWRHLHAKHHGSSGNLDRRGTGDIWTLTVKEYRALPWWRRALYRIYRNPVSMFGAGPLLLFGIWYRLPAGMGDRRARRSVHLTNAALLAGGLAMCAWIGIVHYLMILLPVMLFATSAGTWLFYVQHQFEGVYWERDDEWDYLRQAMDGSSFYRLPRVLQWFTGNIGYHHIHHLSHRIPNYRLEECHRENEMFQCVHEISLGSSLKSLSFRLWDEEERRLVGFGALSAGGR